MIEIIALFAVILQVMDGWTTLIILNKGGTEVNKVMSYLMSKLGVVQTVVVTKWIAIALIWFIYKEEATLLLVGLSVWYAWVVYHNVREL